jgi:hypothetical protein
MDDRPVASVRIERDPTPVMFKRVGDDHAAIGRAWRALEATLGMRQGRRFFGAFDATAGEYRVCVQLREGDDPEALGLESGMLAGGTYLRAQLRGQPPAVYESIPSVFDELEKQAKRDRSRAVIEFYRRDGVIDLLLPVC